MKKNAFLSAALIMTDQAVKLSIACFFREAEISLIPGVLMFCPVQNTRLSWAASLAGFDTPAMLMVCIQVLALGITVLIYRYFAYLMGKSRRYINLYLSFAVSTIACSFIDVVFWGGSLDFIRLFDWFTFDVKDIYANLFVLFLLLHFIVNRKEYAESGEAEPGLLPWIKKGCPTSPQNSRGKK